MGSWSIVGVGLPVDDRFPLQECRIEVDGAVCLLCLESHNCQFNTVPSPFSATSNAIPLSLSPLFSDLRPIQFAIRSSSDTKSARTARLMGPAACTHGASRKMPEMQICKRCLGHVTTEYVVRISTSLHFREALLIFNPFGLASPSLMLKLSKWFPRITS